MTVEVKRGWITVTHSCGHTSMIPERPHNIEWAEKVQHKSCGRTACK